MNLSPRLTAIAIAMATPAAFAATPIEPLTFYGKVNVSVESVSDSKTGFERKTDVLSNSSRFGVKGGAAINDSLDAIYTLEWGVNAADESASSGDKNISARNQYVGLAGGFGELVVGRNDTILKQSQGKVDLFNDLRGDLGNLFVGEVRSELLPAHGGRLVKSLGDGMLLEFGDAPSALAGALGLRLAGPRIYGDVMVEDGWMGDGRAEAVDGHAECDAGPMQGGGRDQEAEAEGQRAGRPEFAALGMTVDERENADDGRGGCDRQTDGGGHQQA